MANTDLNTVQTALTAWIEAASSLQVEWGKEPQKVHMGAFILARAGAMYKLGHDERIQAYPEIGDDTTVRVVGVRHLPLVLSFRSFDQRLGGSARQYAEEFRTLAHSSTSFDTLATAELALVDTGALVESDYVWSGRMVSQVDLEVTIALRADFTDPLHDGSYIKNANVSSASYIIGEDGRPVYDEDGNLISSESTLDIEITS